MDKRKQHKYVFFDEDGNITRLMKCTESVFSLNYDTGNYIVLPRNINVPLDAKIIDGELQSDD